MAETATLRLDVTAEADVPSTDVFVFPVSFAQQRLWLVDQLEPGRSTYNISFDLRLRGVLDVRALEEALTRVVERHETLRTVFDAPDGQPTQVVLPPQQVALAITDISALTADARESELARLVHSEGDRPFDLQVGPIFRARLVRLAADDHALLVTVHHIAADGWSLGVLQRELETAYDALRRGQEPALPELPVQYADFAVWQRDQLQGEALDALLGYWLGKLHAPLPTLDLATDRPRVAGGERRAGRVPVHVPADVFSALVAIAREAGATPFTVLLAAYSVLLYRYTGETDVIVGSPTAGRTRGETEGLIGFFVNTLALRTDLSGAPTFRELVARVHDTVLGALAHQDMPFDKLVEVLEPTRDRTRNPLFQTIFSLQNVPNAAPPALSGLEVTRMASGAGAAKFDLQLLLHSSPDGVGGTLEFDTDLFDQATAEGIVRSYTTLLRSIAAEADDAIDALEIVEASERRTLLQLWNRTDAPWPRNATLASLIHARMRQAPDRIAVVCGSESVTYAELDATSERLAAELRALGVGRGVLVGVYMARSHRMVTTLVAILRAGGAYVPLDPAYPADRLSFIVSDAGAHLVVTEAELRARLPWLEGDSTSGAGGAPRLVIAERLRTFGGAGDVAGTGGAEHGRPAAAVPTDLAYVIYTSGSTGLPKGVEIEHRNAVALVSWAETAFAPAELAGVLAATSISFDLSVFELFVPLALGGTVILAADALALPAVARTSPVPVTLVNTVPSAVEELLRADDGLPQTVRTVNLAGEFLPQRVVDALYARAHVERVYDLYGPSEATTYSTYALRARGGRASIGRPIANTRAYVLDARRRPVPIGVPGELYLAGAGVARGYLNRVELTAERFVTLEFEEVHSERAYRTGDRVRYLASGALEYLGRLDDQVKVRGFRIEPGEIEATLVGHPDVAEAVAVVRTSEAGGSSIVAYYVPARSAPRGDDARPEAAALRTHLRRALPEYMIPAVFVALDAIPRSPNGKLDRAALPAPAAEAGASRYVPPRTTLEHELVHIWERLFGRTPIGIRDDFFELGGHSLLAVRMLHDVERGRGRRLPLASLFDDATIERLAARLEAAVESDAEPPVVVLQEGGRATPFVFVHGDFSGGGWYCRRLAPMLGTDTPLIVLPTLRASGGTPLTIESMASIHLDAVRATQPRGPYRLGGFCVGGLVAFEMARQLQALGERVERLVLIDAPGGNARFRTLDPLLRAYVRGPDDEAGLERRAALMRDLRYYAERWRDVRAQSLSGKLRWVVGMIRRPFAASRGSSKTAEERSAMEAAATMEFVEPPSTRMLRLQARAALAYVPRAYRGSIDLIWASDPSAQRTADPTRGWSRVSASVRVHEVASPHVGLITYNLSMLAECVRASLEVNERSDIVR